MPTRNCSPQACIQPISRTPSTAGTRQPFHSSITGHASRKENRTRTRIRPMNAVMYFILFPYSVNCLRTLWASSTSVTSSTKARIIIWIKERHSVRSALGSVAMKASTASYSSRVHMMSQSAFCLGFSPAIVIISCSRSKG